MKFTGAVRLKDGTKHLIDVYDTEDFPIKSWQEAREALMMYPNAKTALVLVEDNFEERVA